MTLQIRGISKTYPNGVQALKNVTLTIPPGMYGLLGPNGAGKSTLMRILATLQEADSGSVQLANLDVLNQKDEVRQTLGYLPQEFGVYPKVNAEELLEHFAILEYYKCRYAPYTVLHRYLGIIINIYLANFQLVYVIVRNLIDNRCQCCTWTAPWCPEVYEYRFVALQYF